MNGSEKQVAWAESKIATAATLNDNRLTEEQARYDADVAEEGEGNINRLECRRTVHAIIAAGLVSLSATGKATNIIDLGIDTETMILAAQTELLPYKAWIEKAFRSMADFLRWAKV